MTSIKIPNSVTKIGMGAFSYVKNVLYSGSASGSPWGALNVNGKVFDGFIYADAAHTQLTAYVGTDSDVIIPSNVTSIGKAAFYCCKGLKSIEIPNSVKSIGADAFFCCSGLTSIVIPNSVTSIEGYAFYGCNNLKRVYNCSSLTLTQGSYDGGFVAYYATSVYNNCRLEEDYVITYENDNSYVCVYLGQETDLTLPATYGICDYVFSGCTGLTSIEIPNSVKTIGKKAFEGCTGTISINCDIEDAENSNEGWFYGSKFSEVILGETVNKVGKYAFYGSTSIKSLTIGGNVNRIGYYAFDNCTGLKSIYSNAVNPPACRDNAFHEDTKWDCPLYVPKESIDAYKAANVWKSFLDIKENPFYSSLESIATMDKNDAPLYDLQGTQVVAPRPNGLYIRDGKKIILK